MSEGLVRSSAVRDVVGEWRWVCFEGLRTPIVRWVVGREERAAWRAVPSSPAPRRRIWVGLEVFAVIVRLCGEGRDCVVRVETV